MYLCILDIFIPIRSPSRALLLSFLAKNFLPPKMPPPPPTLKRTIYTGTFISTPTPTTLEILENHAIAVDEHGVITDKIAFPPPKREEDSGSSPGRDDDDEVVRGWVERNWGIENDGWEWELVRAGEGREGRGGRGWWFPGFVGEWGFFGMFFFGLFLLSVFFAFLL